jgi:twitching motility protein PilJ
MAFNNKPDTGTQNSHAATLQENGGTRADDEAEPANVSAGQAHAAPRPESKVAHDSSKVAHDAISRQSEGDSLGAGVLPMPQAGAAMRFQRILSLPLAIALVALVAGGWWAVSLASSAARQIGDVSAALIQSHRLVKSVSQSMAGNEGAFKDLRESTDALTGSVRGLNSHLGAVYRDELGKIAQLVSQVGKGAGVVVPRQKLLSDTGRALRAIHDQSDNLLAAAEQVSALKVQRGASPVEISAAGRLVMLTQRIGKTASEMLASDMSANAVSAFGGDITLFQETARGLLDGDSASHLPAARDQDIRGKLQDLLKQFDSISSQAASVLSNPQELNQARTAQLALATSSDALAQELGTLQTRLSAASGLDWQGMAALLVPALVALLAVVGLAYAQLRGSRQGQLQAEQLRQAAERRQQETKRIHDTNQAAILRLMNELQAVSEGDLTQEATVTEDITGAIADSVNYTVEELRTLVGNVQGAATRVTQTTSKMEGTSTDLLAASIEQLREIRETGRSVLDMAGRINQVSTQAQESAQVARQSLKAAASGLTAVQDSIGGMNAIRDQIQETSKRIKRLGESSQEIGEITELIADITEQTNVLALNAAIQAASAGEAGRGFSVVAEEVQRLAERSGQATRQIAALVKAIQTDTQDAAAAMERSTRGVVEGARLSDNAGTALSEIDNVSHRLAQLIEQISSITVQEAQKANTVASNIQHIFAVTEQTGEGTRSTASQVRELARIADDLRHSVARFKIA